MDKLKAQGVIDGPHPIDIAVGQRIRERRLSMGLSQTAVAKQLGVSFQAIQKYERGYMRVSASRLISLAEALNVPVAYFFDNLAPQTSDPDFDRSTAELIRAAQQLPADVRRTFTSCMRLVNRRIGPNAREKRRN